MLLNLNLIWIWIPILVRLYPYIRSIPGIRIMSVLCGGGQGGLDPLPPGFNPYPRPFFPSLPPPIFFLIFFFGYPRPKFRFFAPHPRPSAPPPPRPVLVKSPPTPAPLPPGPRPLSSPTIMHGGHQLQTRPVLIRSIPICKKFSQESHHRFSVRANYVVSFVSS